MANVIDVYDNLLEPEIAEQISREMKTLMWSFEHYSDKQKRIYIGIYHPIIVVSL